MRTLYEGENRKQKRLKAITIRRQFQVYPGHYFKNGYDLFLVNRVARGVFLTWFQAVPVFCCEGNS